MPRQPRADRPDTPGDPIYHFERGFKFYLDGRHAVRIGQNQEAGYLFHIGVELMLKAVLLEETYQSARRCVDEARQALIERVGQDVFDRNPDNFEIDRAVGDACLEPFRRRAEQLKNDYMHSLDRLWRESLEVIGKPELGRFGPLITKIAQWEGYRYPVFRHGRSDVRTVTRGKGARVRHRGRNLVNRSDVNLAEVDEFIASLVPAKYTVAWVLFQLPNQLALETYLTDNAYPIAGIDQS